MSGTTRHTKEESWLCDYVMGGRRRGKGQPFEEWARPPDKEHLRTIRYRTWLDLLAMPTFIVWTHIESRTVHPMRGYNFDWVEGELQKAGQSFTGRQDEDPVYYATGSVSYTDVEDAIKTIMNEQTFGESGYSWIT